MKTKFLKFGLPLAAFMLAIVFAFATQNRTSLQEEAYLSGFVYDDAKTECVTANKDCAIDGTTPCQQSDGEHIYRFSNPAGTMCFTALYEWPNE